MPNLWLNYPKKLRSSVSKKTRGTKLSILSLICLFFKAWGVWFLSVLSLFLDRHFPVSDFNGRLQVGSHGQFVGAILPVFTCDYDCLCSSFSDFIFYPHVDYYISVNAVSGVQRHSSDLFALHNIVIDIDCHSSMSLTSRDVLLDLLLDRFEHSIFNFALAVPTSIVKTGRGIQLWWSIRGISAKFKPFYDEVLDYYIASLSEVLVDGALEDFSMFQVDVGASKNVVGYFRLPGTMNTKTNTLVTYTACAGTYELMELFTQMKYCQAEKPLKLQEVDLAQSKVCSMFSRDYVDLAHQRVDMYYKLRDMRDATVGVEERNNFCFMVYNAFAPCYGHDVSFGKMQQFNAGFQEPLSNRELNVVISSAKDKGGYQYTTRKIVEFLHISTEEEQQLGLADTDLGYLNKRKQKQVRNLTKKDQRNEAVLNLYDSGKTAQSIAKECNLSINTVKKILVEHGRSHKTSRKEQILALQEDGKSLEEIAQICGCSVKTVRRGLVL